MSATTPVQRWWPMIAVIVVAGGIGYAVGRDAMSGAEGGSPEAGREQVSEERAGEAAPESLERAPASARDSAPVAVERETAGSEEPADPPTRQPPAPASDAPLVVPAGTKVEIELVAGVSSQSAAVGDPVRARLASPILAGGAVALPQGAPIHGRVTQVRALRKVGGQAELALAFDSVEVGGELVPIEAYFARTGRNETRRDAAAIAAGTIVGTVLGNQAKKNDRGKVVGGLVGAGVGTAIAAATEGEAIELGAGDRLELTLRGDVELRRGA